MEKVMYMMLIEKTKTYNRLTKKAVTEHVENIRKLDDAGKLEICGVFRGYPGMAGMYILKTESREDAGGSPMRDGAPCHRRIRGL